MIHIIDPVLFVEKRVFCTLEDLHYVPFQTTYLLNGFDLSRHLTNYKLEYCRYSFCSMQANAMLDDASTIALQTNRALRYQTKLIVEDQVFDELSDPTNILEDYEFVIYKSILQEKLPMESFVVLKAMQETLTFDQLQSLHSLCKTKNSLLVCAYHPMYYDALSNMKCNVLVVDARQLANSFAFNHQLLAYIKQKICKLAVITIVPLSSNELRIFYKDKHFSATYSKIEAHQSWDVEAVLLGVCQCYEQEGSMDTLLTLALSMMVSSALSGGIYQGSLDVLHQIQEGIEIAELGV